MKFRISVLAVATILFSLIIFAAEPHRDHGSGHHALQLNQGEKWATDTPLRKGMDAIRTSIAAIMPEAKAGKVTADAYDALGRELDEQVNFILQNCKLTPRADAQLHVILAEVLQGIEAINGKGSNRNRAHGVIIIASALNRYGQYFDHPGWQPVKLR